MKLLGQIILTIAIVLGMAYLFVEAATGECVGASYCDKVNAK